MGRRRLSPFPGARRRPRAGGALGAGRIAVLLGLLAAVIAAAAIAGHVAASDRGARAQNELDRATDDLRHRLGTSTQTLRGVRGLFVAGRGISGDQFDRYTATQLKGSQLFGVGWLPLVRHSGRAAFERRHGLRILEVASGGTLETIAVRPSRRHATYLPHLYSRRTAASGPRVPRGLNALESPLQASTIARAAASGLPVMAPAITTGGQDIIQTTLAVYAPGAPVGTPDERAAALRGITVGRVPLGELVGGLRAAMPAGNRLEVGPAGYSGANDPGFEGEAARTVEVSGLDWTLRVGLAPSARDRVLPAGILAAGTTLVALVALLFAQGSRRERESAAAATRSAALRRVAVAAAADRDDIFVVVAREAAGLMGADGALVANFDGDPLRVMGMWGGGLGPPSAVVARHSNGVLGRIARSGGPARVDDYGALSEDDAVALGTWSRTLGSAVGVPVRVDGRLWGGLLVAHSGAQPFPPGAEAELALFADIMATAIASTEARRALALQATTDPLTGLANRRAFEERLEAETARAACAGHPLALVLMDIDHFKTVNDTLGHGAGDAVLVELAGRLAAQGRPQDLVARIGGEEFVWLLTGTDSDEARGAAERARRATCSASFGVGRRITVSAGVCALDAAPAVGGLLRGADMALYRAKRAGRDRVAVHEGAG